MGFCWLQGYDVVAIACPDRYVVGLDISEVALERAKVVTTYFPNALFVPSHWSVFLFMKSLGTFLAGQWGSAKPSRGIG